MGIHAKDVLHINAAQCQSTWAEIGITPEEQLLPEVLPGKKEYGHAHK